MLTPFKFPTITRFTEVTEYGVHGEDATHIVAQPRYYGEPVRTAAVARVRVESNRTVIGDEVTNTATLVKVFTRMVLVDGTLSSSETRLKPEDWPAEVEQLVKDIIGGERA